MPVFSTADGVFSLDGKPMTILSGAIHYFRTHPDQWRDRLEKAQGLRLQYRGDLHPLESA